MALIPGRPKLPSQRDLRCRSTGACSGRWSRPDRRSRGLSSQLSVAPSRPRAAKPTPALSNSNTGKELGVGRTGGAISELARALGSPSLTVTPPSAWSPSLTSGFRTL